MKKENLEFQAHVEIHLDALGIVVFVGELGGGIVCVVETTLLITAGLDFAVIENVVHIEVEVERELAVEIHHLADACVEHESVVKLLLTGDFVDFCVKLFLAAANLPQVGHCLVANG